MTRRLLRGLALCLLAAPAGAADMLADCERHAVSFFRAAGADIRSVTIDRGDSLVVDRYDADVGRQRVATEYFGWADVASGDGTRRQRFVCLHAGAGKGAVYVGFFPD